MFLKPYSFTVEMRADNSVRLPLMACARALASPEEVRVEFQASQTHKHKFEKVSISCAQRGVCQRLQDRLPAYASNNWRFYSSQIIVPEINELAKSKLRETLEALRVRYGGLMSILSNSTGGIFKAEFHFTNSEIRDAFTACKFLTGLKETERLAHFSLQMDPLRRCSVLASIESVFDEAYESKPHVHILAGSLQAPNDLMFLATDKASAAQFADRLAQRNRGAVNISDLTFDPDIALGALASRGRDLVRAVDYIGSALKRS